MNTATMIMPVMNMQVIEYCKIIYIGFRGSLSWPATGEAAFFRLGNKYDMSHLEGRSEEAIAKKIIESGSIFTL